MLFIFNKATICFLILNWFLITSPRATEIEKIDDNTYYSSKIIPYKEINDTTNHDLVYFCCEKLSYSNIMFWLKYASKDYEDRKNIDNSNHTAGLAAIDKNNHTEGLVAFEYSLEIFSGCQSLNETEKQNFKQFGDDNREALKAENEEILLKANKFLVDTLYDTWIAYATRKNPKIEKISEEDIEMVVSVFLSDAPIATPMGISRSFSYSCKDKKPHIGLSMQLHGFWAKVSEQIYGPKSYAVTSPTKHMRDIIENTLKGQELESLNDNLTSNSDKLWSLTDPRSRAEIEFKKPEWFPQFENDNFIKGHFALIITSENPRIKIDMMALTNLWDTPLIS